MEQTTISIANIRYVLAQNTDIHQLEADVLSAVTTGAAYVELTIVGNHRVKVLLQPGFLITFTTETVPEDPRDTGDITYPYDEFDLLTP